MSLAIIFTRARIGIDAPLVTVEVHLSNGLPGLSIVGMPETAVKESKDRVRSALINSHFEFPARRITINLAPADLPKEGSRFDLPIAIGILAASGQLDHAVLKQYEFIGELALSGKLRPVTGILPAAIACGEKSRQLITESSNAKQAALYESCNALSAESLLSVCKHLQGEQALPQAEPEAPKAEKIAADFSEIIGQDFAKRALEIAAAGGHNLLLYGPPGTGKTMLASRIPGIMPTLTSSEAITVASIYSLCNSNHHWKQVNFRSPHHSSSAVAMVGGGSHPKPGEISLSHCGILFLDELPEFQRQVLEVLREPMESGEIHISRANAQVTFPAQFQLVAAMNPCPCGYYGSPSDKHHCRCSTEKIKRYREKISGPLLDRIDLHVAVDPIPITDLQTDKISESSESIYQRVLTARNIQQARQNTINARLSKADLKHYCKLDSQSHNFLLTAIEKMGLSIRAHDKILKISRTIADLDNEKNIQKNHIVEALSFRNFDRKLSN